MFDDSLRLQENPVLLALLLHYAQLGSEDRATWRDRLMQIDGVEPKQLSALHGELIAFGWIEQNTGQAILRQDGTLSACYWITLHGLRDYRQFQGVEAEVERSETPDKTQLGFPLKKKAKAEAVAVSA
jgi:hypothetical protein